MLIISNLIDKYNWYTLYILLVYPKSHLAGDGSFKKKVQSFFNSGLKISYIHDFEKKICRGLKVMAKMS